MTAAALDTIIAIRRKLPDDLTPLVSSMLQSDEGEIQSLKATTLSQIETRLESNQSMDLVIHDSVHPTDELLVEPTVYGVHELKAQVVFPSIKNPPVVNASLKSDEPELGSSDESISPWKDGKKTNTLKK